MYISLLIIHFLHVLVSQAQSVQISAGSILGTKCNHSDVRAFLGIPYAVPPVGALRFRPPQPYTSTFPPAGFNATRPAVNCPQFGTAFVEQGPQSEDCLFLDIYRPANSSNSSSLPVKVWIYGGSNVAGGISNPTYTGCFAAEDSIFVSINYRLGPLGYLALQEAGLTGNYGLQDQLLALQWVNQNIAAFGGDPKRVMLFGQSAGAINVFSLATLPQIKSLISSAVMESGGGRDQPSISNVQPYHKQFAQIVNCSNISCLQTVSVDTMKGAVIKLTENFVGASTLLENNGAGQGWGPVVDGVVLPVQPSQRGVQVPSIFGSNAQEGTLFVLDAYGSKIQNLTQKNYTDFLAANFGTFAGKVEQEFPLSLFNMTPLPVYAAIVSVVTDNAYKCSAYRGLTTAAANNIDVWTYRFNVTPSCPWYEGFPYDARTRQLLGCTHTAEIPFVFGEVDNLPLPAGNCSLSSSERAISMFMKGAWTSFSATGNPSASWPRWNGSAGINIGPSVQAGPVDYSSCKLWDQIDAALLQLVSANASQTNASSTGVPSPRPTAYTGDTHIQRPARGLGLAITFVCIAALVSM